MARWEGARGSVVREGGGEGEQRKRECCEGGGGRESRGRGRRHRVLGWPRW